MKFDYNNETKEYVCPECGQNYEQYNSLFKHYQRTHPASRNNDDKTPFINDTSRTNSLTKDDKIVTISRDKSVISDKINDISIDKERAKKVLINILIFSMGIVLIGILYKKGFFDPLSERFRPVTQKQRSIFK